jgi:hypothetical protein
MARARRVLSGLVAAGVSVLLIGLMPSSAVAEETVAFTIKDPRIDQSSGLARDVAAGLYWTANDAGATGIAYGLTATGVVRGTLNYRPQPVDVKAVALVADRLYIGDIGDNAHTRKFIRVYRFSRPRATGLTVTYRAYDFAYPNGSHDAETLLVNEKGQIFVVTKGKKGAIYAGPAVASRQGINQLEKVGSAPAKITDGTFLPGSKQIALRTHSAVYVLDATTYKVVASAEVPTQPQGESLAVSLDGNSLLLGSAGKQSKVYAIPVPTELAESPSPSATPSTTTEPSDPGDDPDVSNDNAGESRKGTFLALGLAALVAVVAGVVVGVIRRP